MTNYCLLPSRPGPLSAGLSASSKVLAISPDQDQALASYSDSDVPTNVLSSPTSVTPSQAAAYLADTRWYVL